MPEEKENKSVDLKDGVDRDDYNKVVESRNSLKLENEKLQEQIKQKQEQEKQTEEMKWKEENEKLKRQNEDLKKIAEEKNTTVAKGIINEPPKEETPIIKVKKVLDEKLPDRKVNPEKFGSAIQRYGHYKSGTTKQYTDDQLGMGLSLHANAQKINPDLIGMAKDRLPGQDEIILRK